MLEPFSVTTAPVKPSASSVRVEYHGTPAPPPIAWGVCFHP